MNIYSNKFINLISIIITIIVFLIISFSINKIQKNNSENILVEEKIAEEKENEENLTETFLNDELLEDEKEQELKWSIQIKSIDLIAPIEESTEMKILNKYIGHFEETALTEGNIGLAGHNRGYEKNYFENLKNVKKGDEIIYTYNEYTKTYIVDKIEIIRNTDWSYLEETEENKITMITCTENEPDYRLCVQATEKE